MQTIIDWLIKLLLWIVEQLRAWGNSGENPPPPPPPVEQPFYVADMARTHPERSGEELAQTVTLEALQDTQFHIHTVDHAGSIIRNEAGNMILRKMAGQEIEKGQTVEVFRWAFPVDSGVVRESRWHITDQKGLIDIKAFSKPE